MTNLAVFSMKWSYLPLSNSTESAVISFTVTICPNMDQGYLTGAVFIDLGKAFDTVDHELLLEKLREYGLEGIDLVWFKDYSQ